MNLHGVDYLIIVTLLGLVLGAAVFTRRYVLSVADFLSANRCAGRYLLTVAATTSGIGAISIVAQWEQYYQAGFGAFHWGAMTAPIGLVLALSGWVIYRYRQSRAMTLAQFLEMRYSRRFRVFSGMLCWASGILNYGIFPAVTARFFVYFLGLPVHTWAVPGVSLELNLTLMAVMAFMLGLAVTVTLLGGQIAVMVSDFVQGQFMNICFVLLLGVLLFLFPWGTVVRTLEHAPPGQSRLNPFDQGRLEAFNPWYFVMAAFLGVYNFMVWQGSQAYNSSAKSPHEAKIAGVLAGFRGIVQGLMIPMAAICAFVLLKNDALYPQASATIQQVLDQMPSEQTAQQMTTTVAMSQVLPVGMLGLLASVMIMAALSTDSTYLHSWGSIFIQDVLMPLRQARSRPKLSPEAHLRWLRRSVVFVAVFAFVFSSLFPLEEFIFMYMQATGAIFTGGAGAVLIGGLYWRRGSTAGAWAAMIVGSTLAVAGVLINNILWPRVLPLLKQRVSQDHWLHSLPEAFWLNGIQMAVLASLCAIASYVIASLLSHAGRVDFDKLFHRGPYAPALKPGEPADHVEMPQAYEPSRLLKALGITREFTRGDRWLYYVKYFLFLYSFGGFVVLTAVYLAFGLMNTESSWATWWLVLIVFKGLIGIVATVWFLVGGIRDLLDLFRTLGSLDRDSQDDGTVAEHLGQTRTD